MDISFKVIGTPSFKRELFESCWYIQYHLYNPNAAIRLHNKAKEAITKLKYSPGVYPRIYELNYGEFRKILVNKYVIVYEVDRSERKGLCSTYIS